MRALFWFLTVSTLSCAPREALHSSAAPSGSAPAAAWVPKILSDSSVYLPDFSYAGYHFGERALPTSAATLEAADFGAIPNDALDDTDALKRALAAADALPGPVVLHLAKGRFLISDSLYLERSQLILQGSGSGREGTELFVTKPMWDMPRNAVMQKIEAYLVSNDKRVDGKPFSPFSWTGGVLWARRKAEPAQAPLAAVLEGARGAHVVRLDKALPVGPGSIVRLRWFNRGGDDSALLQHVFGLQGIAFGPRLSDSKGDAIVTEEATVRAVSGNELTLVQPLLHDIRAGWTVDLIEPAFLEEVGIEHLAVVFPDQPYAGHHLERGYNGIYLTGLANSFVRDVRFENADSALLSDDCANVTLSQLAILGRLGHYGVHLGDVFDFLLEDFEIDSEEFHSVSFNTKARANVATHGVIHRPSLDQHRGANHQNLFDDLSTLEDRPKSHFFEHGGADYWGPTHGAFNTFWNVRLEFENATRGRAMFLGKIDDAGPARIVGLTSNSNIAFEYAHAYVEGIGVPGIAVPSLYQYQLKRRLQSGSTPETKTLSR